MAHGPLDFFDTLVATEWTERFESFSPPELELLRKYEALASELGRRPFFAQPQRLSVKASPEESYERLDHAGEDALRSMAMTFRRLWLQGEPARFELILRLLRDHARLDSRGGEARRLLEHLGRRYRNAKREVLMRHVREDDPVGEPIRVFRAEDVIDDWLYSGPFHEDDDRAARVASWSPVGYEWSFIKGITGVAAVMWELHVVVVAVLADASATTTAAA